MSSINVSYNGSRFHVFSADRNENFTELFFQKIKIANLHTAISAYLQASRIQRLIKTEKLYIPLSDLPEGYIIATLNSKNRLTRLEFSAKNIGFFRKLWLRFQINSTLNYLNMPIKPIFKPHDFTIAHKLTLTPLSTLPPEKILLPNLFDYSLQELVENTTLLDSLKKLYAANKKSRFQNLGHNHKYRAAENLGLRLTAKNFITDLFIYLKNNQPYFFQRQKIKYHNILTAYANDLLKTWLEKKVEKLPVIKLCDPTLISPSRNLRKELAFTPLSRKKYDSIFKIIASMKKDVEGIATKKADNTNLLTALAVGGVERDKLV